MTTLAALINSVTLTVCRILCILLLCSQAQAQLKADFTADKTGGCGPLTVSFTNTSSGYSSNVIYQWDLGNGNTSSLTNAGAIYKDEKVYTVTLTVKDGSQTSVKTQYITVHSKPAVDFSANVAKGCLPLNVTFTSNSTAGSGNISSYYWDFGDGATQQGYSNTQPHSYTLEQLSTVSLTVTNNFGCHATVQKKDIVQVIPSLTAGFSADKRILCRETDPVQFTNYSAGPGTLSYNWDFGDGTTSTDRNPSHVFNRRGIYNVKLTVNSSEGCTVSSSQTGYINVATFSTDFTTPASFCSQTSAQFTNMSSPQANNSVWEIDGQVYSYGDYFSYFFQNAGTHKIKLTNTYGTCVDSAIKNITVKQTPITTGFISTVKGFCGAPVGVDFKDTTADAVAWNWNLDWTSSGNSFNNKQAFTHTYTENRLYHVLLKVTNSAGCTKELYQLVNLPFPTVQIYRISSSSNPPNVTCGGSITMKFGSNATEPVTQSRWEFGDGGTSTEAEPEHTFSTPGEFQVKLHYTTASGCTGTAYYNSVTIHRKPEADFRILGGTNICGNTQVVFSSLTPGNLTNMAWYVDGNYIGQANFSSLPWQFEDKGKHSIKLIAWNGTCSDTAEKIDYVEVFPPFPKISAVQKTCEGTRGLVTFTQASREAQTWKWDFGDGNTVTLPTDQASVSHTYTKTGKYTVKLITTSGACTVEDAMGIDVMVKTNIQLSAPASICVGSNLNYTLTNLQDNPVTDPWNQNYTFGGFLYEDGTPFTGYHNAYYIDKWPNFNGSLSQPDETKQQIRAIIVSNWFGCRDTTNFVPIKVVGLQAALDMNDASVCFNSPVTFMDRTTITNGAIIKKWDWSFGDGQGITTTQPGNVSHSYPNPGTYYVSLRVTDDKGCSSTTPTYTQYVTVTGPKAAFSASGTNVPLNTTVSFYNYTNSIGAYNTIFEWDFGDGSNSTAYSPSHTYPVAGTYTIKLTASDAMTGCSSETSQTIVVRDFNTAFNFNMSHITAQSCPPVLVRFNNTSINFTSVTWDFGDGIRVNNVNYPSHIYEKPGKYIITLYVYGPNGLKGTYIDSVVVQQPRATMQADDLEGCIGNIVTLNAKADSTKSYTWDFGDGHVVTTTDTFATHQFKTPGTYSPSLLIRDANGCASSTAMTDKIIIRPDPVVNVSPAQPIVCLGQGTTLQASGGATYNWSPATGLNNSAVASPVANPAENTTYTVRVADDIGCQASGSVSVTVVQPVSVAVPSNLSVCAGNTVTIPASGAEIYNWIYNTVGLSDTHIANPSAKPAITTTYTVTGSDAHQCFTDTAEITVRVLPLPTVDAGINEEVQAGTPVNLAPTFSTDVVQWTWTPATYLNCSNCPNPVSTPLAQTQYVLTVKNGVGCTAKDSLTIKMICDEARVRIPNAITPNGDSYNDEFIIKGISLVKHLVIYNRWGQKVFERSNFIAADRSAAWNGTLNGQPASEGTYVYFIEMECPTGGAFTKKGSFVLVR